MKRAAPKAGGGGKNKPYARPEVISTGEILTDVCNKKWKIGKSIGAGGFGDIYLASDDVSKPVSEKTAHYVIKIEPHANGPLYVEIAFYMRAAKTEMVQEWKKANRLDTLGMPCYIASGSHSYKSQKYRFMVIPRFGQDLYKILDAKQAKRFSCKTVQAISLQIIDILEYIHSRGFIHGDIKASNLLLDAGKPNQLYLLDYGLAGRYLSTADKHLDYAPDLRRAHNGTLEYTSRDAHIGALSRRGDLEILGYNMLEWLFGKLPWSRTETPDYVHKQKCTFMSNIQLKKIYPADIPGFDLVEKFLKYTASLNFEQTPNYNHCREILRRGLPNKVTSLYLEDSTTVAKPAPPKPKNKRSPAKVVSEEEEEEEQLTQPKKIKLPDDPAAKAKRSTRTTKKVKKGFNWARVLSSNPEKLLHSASQTNNGGLHPPSTPTDEKKLPLLEGNPTPAMMAILFKKKENVQETPFSTRVPRTDQLEGSNALTPAMKAILMRTKKRSLRKSMSESDLSFSPKIKPRKKIPAAAGAPPAAVVVPAAVVAQVPAPRLVPAMSSRQARSLRRNP